MGEQLSFDTTFLIDLQREKVAGKRGPAHRFLKQNAGAQMVLSSVALGEFAEGFERQDDAVLRMLMAAVHILEVDSETAWLYASNARRLRLSGRLIGSNDLWIGCCAVRRGVSLVSRNGGHFRRIQNLRVVEY